MLIFLAMATSAVQAQTFFQTFERLSAAGDAEALAGLYAATFLSAGPDGVQTVKASDLIQVIPKRKQLLQSIGCQSTKLASVEETKLDDHYSLCRTEWCWRFDHADGPVEITLPSTFVVHRSGEGWRIVLYLTHHNIMTVLRERGMLPAAKG